MVVRALNGVGMVASRARMIRPGFEYDAYFPKPTNENPILSKNAENEDTLENFIPQMAFQYKADTERIALVIKQPTLYATCKAIWDFPYNHIQYKLDDPHEEQIRRPARTWADRKSGVDCDCYSVFISSILLNLGIRHSIRMTAYNRQRGFQHVYVVVPKTPTSDMNRRSDYIVIDCVMDAFDSEKPFIQKKDKEIKPLISAGLNGFPVRALNGGFKSRSNLVYNDVYYVPAAGTWALKGIDGGYYLRGDKNLRYVEPLDNHLSGGFLKKVVKAGLKIAKPLAKTALNVIAPGSAEALTALKKAKTSLKDAKIPKLDIKKAKTQAINSLDDLTKKNDQQNLNDSLEKKIKATNNNTIQSLDTTKTAITRSIQANNKAVITSLDAVDKSTKDRLDKFATSVNQTLEQMQSKSSNTEDATKTIQDAVQKNASLTAGTQVLAREQTETLKSEAQKNENFRSQVTTWGKYALIAVALLVIWFLYTKKQTVTNY